jgi:hypothetical protein
MKKKHISQDADGVEIGRDRELTAKIRRLLDKPMNQRTHLLRKRKPLRITPLAADAKHPNSAHPARSLQ